MTSEDLAKELESAVRDNMEVLNKLNTITAKSGGINPLAVSVIAVTQRLKVLIDGAVGDKSTDNRIRFEINAERAMHAELTRMLSEIQQELLTQGTNHGSLIIPGK